VTGVDRIAEAMHDPPREGRARQRGDTIRRAVGEKRMLYCSWDGLWDPVSPAHFDLSHPFENTEEWAPYTPPDRMGNDWDWFAFFERRRRAVASGSQSQR
jgi:hypothetical protein